MISRGYRLFLCILFGAQLFCLSSCNFFNADNEDIKLKPIKAYLKNDDLYIDLISNRKLYLELQSGSSDELLSRIECTYDKNQKNIYNKDFSLKDNEVIIDDSYEYTKLVQEKSTDSDFYYQIKLLGFIKNQTVFHNNTMSCRFMVGKLIGGKKVSNVIQFDMSNLYN